MDETQSFYIADVEIVDNRQEVLTPDLEANALAIHENIPGLVKEYVLAVVKEDRASPAEINKILTEIGPMPSKMKERAIWVGALVNPIPPLGPLGVCAEIRPAMMACRNDHDRVLLASAALMSSIDSLNGKGKE